MTTINIVEYIQDKESLFNIKRFKYKNYSCNSTIKTVDLKNLTSSIFKEIQDSWKGKFIFENTKEVQLSYLLKITELGKEKQDAFFGKRSYLNSNEPLLNLYTINPDVKKLDEIKNIKTFTNFFDLYYGYSNFLLFVPNIRIKKTQTILTKEKKKRAITSKIMSSKDYIDYVDDMYAILNYRNNKEIFVPLSLKFGIKEIQEIVDHYIKQEYFNIWIDYEGSALNSRSIGLIRSIFRFLEENKRLEDTLFYYTNIKREIISHVLDNETPSSDVLSPICGANIVGINREPKRIFTGTPKYSKMELIMHKARLFDNKTYYYRKPSIKNIQIKDKEFVRKNIITNNNLLNFEILNQCNEFARDYEIRSYISKKKMINSFKKGEMLPIMFEVKEFHEISEWF